MYRTWVILRHTFTEAIFQPIFTLMILFGAVTLAVFGALPFFTFGEDTLMFKRVAMDVVLLFVLVPTLFVTSRSIFEEIEDRTMLTLMSKPVKRWEVMVGKYLGILAAAALGLAVLGVVIGLAIYWRIPTDYQIRPSALDVREMTNLRETRAMHLAGLYPSLVLMWLQIAVLAAIGVAISTRFSLVVNLPAVVLIYVAGNLARFAPSWSQVTGSVWSSLAAKAALILSYFLPFLQVFDLYQLTIFRPIALPGTQFANQFNSVTLAEIWANVGLATVHAACYSVFALAVGLFFFRNRELGGSEG
jgi:ABC-type Na+ efflux pump permease subunit